MNRSKQAVVKRKLNSVLMEVLEPRQLMSAGTLDSRFGSGGMVEQSYNGNYVQSNAICFDTENRLYAVGTELNAEGVDQFEAMRYFANGSLDSSFGTNGIVDGGTGDNQEATGCAVDSRGLVIVGTTQNGSSSTEDMFITRLGSDGFYDRSFGNSGETYLDFSPSSAPTFNQNPTTFVGIEPNGDYIVVGQVNSATTDQDSLAITVLSPGGQVLHGFTSNFGGSDLISGMALDSKGAVYVAGDQFDGTVTGGFVAKYSPYAQTLDTSFNDAGVKFLGPSDEPQAIKVSPGNQVVVAGLADSIGGDFVETINSSGSVAASTTFGFGNVGFGINSLDVRPDGKIIVAGTMSNPAEGSYDDGFAAAQLNSNLTFDGSYGTPVAAEGGTSVTGLRIAEAPFSEGLATSVAFDGDGRAFVGGYSYVNDANGDQTQESAITCFQTAESPYTGNAATTGQTIEAANFDYGGQGVGYSDDNIQNYGTTYRATGVDVYSEKAGIISNGTGPNTVVGFIQPGEYMNYTVSVPTTGDYEFQAFGGSLLSGATLEVLIDGSAKTGNIAVPVVTQTYDTFGANNLYLTAGTHVMRVSFGGPDGSVEEMQSFKLLAEHAPTISSLAASSTKVTAGTNVTLTAHGVTDSDGNVKIVSFFRESNGHPGLNSGDALIATTTGSGGTYSASVSTANLAPGTYTFYAQATDTTNLTSNVVSTTVTVEQTGSIKGSVFNDVNGNGTQNSGEAGLSGWRVYLDTNKDGVFETSEKSVITSSTGSWSFSNLPLGTYRVREVPQSGWRLTTPSSGYYDITLTSAAANVTAKLFGDTKSVAITGNVFADSNSNGKKDSTEKGVSGWTVYLDTNNDGKLETGEKSVVTDANGNFSFTGLTAGTYIVRVVAKSGSRITDPASGNYLLTLASGTLDSILFGEH